MDKEILKQYIDACEQVKEAKADILRLKKNRKKIVQDRVSGSAHEFPYTAKSFHIEGLSYPVVKDPDELDRREAILQERLQKAEEIKRQVSVSTSIAPFAWGSTKINLIDTPGLFDFAGEAAEGARAVESLLITVSGKSGVLDQLSGKVPLRPLECAAAARFVKRLSRHAAVHQIVHCGRNNFFIAALQRKSG